MALVAICFAAGMVAGWWPPLAGRLDNYAYDFLLRASPAPHREPEVVVVGVDPRQYRLRAILADALKTVAAAQPKAVAVDVLLPDAGDPADDAALEQAMRATPNLILACEAGEGKFENPLPRFAGLAAGVGHVNLPADRADAVGRQIPLEEAGGGERRWALSLEAFRVARGAAVVESPEDLQIGGVVIPAPRSGGRQMLIRYLPEGVPAFPVAEAAAHPERLRGKTVFVGETALSAAHDRVLDPYGRNLPGVAVHAHAYETMARGDFLKPASNTLELLIPLAFAAGAALIFAFTTGWVSYVLIVPLLAAAHWLVPLALFRHGVVLSYFAPVAVTWLCSAGAGAYQHIFVRRQLRRTESEKSRYQQAIHWAAHEMRTPLTAIQGSSEIMAKYNLPETKRNQLSEMIHSESKRLSRIIQTFLDVERLAEGQMEMKREPFRAAEIVDSCLRRVTPLAERKQIAIHLDNEVDGALVGDRELMEYAVYNLLTNAVKYSPANTEIHVFSVLKDGELRLAVKDQGIGMDSKEIKNIFRKFYRTKRAEASGEAGTGIGLSIVEQIVTHHKGRIEVASTPGRGSCFTIVLNAQSAASRNVQTADRRG